MDILYTVFKDTQTETLQTLQCREGELQKEIENAIGHNTNLSDRLSQLQSLNDILSDELLHLQQNKIEFALNTNRSINELRSLLNKYQNILSDNKNTKHPLPPSQFNSTIDTIIKSIPIQIDNHAQIKPPKPKPSSQSQASSSRHQQLPKRNQKSVGIVIVHGFIYEHQQQYGLDCIPPNVMNIILLFFHQIEYFIECGSKMSISSNTNERDTVTRHFEHDCLWNTAFGHFYIDSIKHPNWTYIWRLNVDLRQSHRGAHALHKDGSVHSDVSHIGLHSAERGEFDCNGIAFHSEHEPIFYGVSIDNVNENGINTLTNSFEDLYTVNLNGISYMYAVNSLCDEKISKGMHRMEIIFNPTERRIIYLFDDKLMAKFTEVDIGKKYKLGVSLNMKDHSVQIVDFRIMHLYEYKEMKRYKEYEQKIEDIDDGTDEMWHKIAESKYQESSVVL